MLEIEGLTKRFGGVTALDGVRLDVAAGRVHALLGENGAGKSTLLKCLSGVHRADAGTMQLSGRAYQPADPRAVEAAGLRTVHQELNLVPGFTAYENAYVGRAYPRHLGRVDWKAMRSRFAALRDRYRLDLDIDTPVGRLSVAKCQIVEILRALMDDARVLILDEPTASLSEEEATVLRRIVRDLADQGCAIIFVSHRLDEVFALADDYTVLRNGQSVGSGQIADTSRDEIVALMAGEAFRHERHGDARTPGDPVLELAGFRVSPVRAPIDLTVRTGEIVGLYGVVGSGRSSLLKAVWGASGVAEGDIALEGAPLPASGIESRKRAGVAYVCEDRRNTGLVMHHSILDNAVLPHLERHRAVGSLPIVSWRRARAGVRAALEGLSVKYGGLGDRISTLSGGNQQKIMIGRWFDPSLKLFLLDEPTRGVDVRSKAEIHALCNRLAGEGAAVLFATSDLEELLMLASRVVVMAQGAVTLDAPNSAVSRQSVIDATFHAPPQPSKPEIRV
ncbi:D-ribose transport system ATP-binding protein [Nitratireductor aquibiodomus RA22]|uniref:D-ribose transport system ATP-binding protein n=1 Tax=Nitratireductor aquibiodomus RA22 TaxID=1189611 RepID=I5C6A7_9HYPH|nr:sugar ABC transporter ATP-binding protein [Nitratireductor aquibiodomus]EIM77359.1 D-ribose transport system ATP-binding protein [Nitratireductor aquibiodomus RA22]